MRGDESHWLADVGLDGAVDTGTSPPRAVDVAVVGGGVIGVACAYWIARLGGEVALIEARRVADGASGRNGGFFLGTPTQMAKLHELLTHERIDAGLAECGHVALASSDEMMEQFAEELERRGPDAAHVELLARSDCEDLLGLAIAKRFRGGRSQPSGATVDPARLVFGLAAAAARRGARIVEHCSVRAVEPRRAGGVALTTEAGRLNARHAIVACAARSTDLLRGGDGLLTVTRAQMLATEPLPPRFPYGMAVDFGALYWRQTGDGTIVIGGCRDADPVTEASADEAVNPVVQHALERFLPEAFPGFGSVQAARRWAGVMDGTRDGRPVVGRWPGAPGVWIAAGFGGHGLPPASGVGRVLAEAVVLGRDSEWLSRLAPDRDREAVAA